MKDLETMGEEHLIVAAGGAEFVTICVSHPWFGRVATVRLDLRQAFDLVAAVREVAAGDMPDAA
jgi:hypothetical protein